MSHANTMRNWNIFRFLGFGSTTSAVPERQVSEEVRQKLALAIREASLRYKDKQTGLARELGVTQGNISGWISGKHSPSLGNLLELRDILHQPIDDLLGLPAIPGFPGRDASLEEVKRYYRGRWPEKVLKFFEGEERPEGGWKDALDELTLRTPSAKDWIQQLLKDEASEE